MFAHPNPSLEAGIDLVVTSLHMMRRLAKTWGVRFHILAHYGLRGQPPFNKSIWECFLNQSGAIDITKRILAFDGPDPVGYDGGHWSAEGHRRVASIIKSEFLLVPQGR